VVVGPIDTSVSQRTNTSIGIGPSVFLQQRDVGQCFYFDVFSTYARHNLPNAEEFDEIKAAVKSVTTNVTSQRSGSTNRMSQLNSEVSSWNTKRQIFPSSSTIFNESIG